MPAGHTDRRTINTRKPLTARMRDLLASVANREHSRTPLLFGAMCNGDKNAARGLLDRGYVHYETSAMPIFVTDAGRAALGQQ